MAVEYAKPNAGRRPRRRPRTGARRSGRARGRGRWRSRLRRSRRWAAWHGTQAVMLLQGAVVLTFAVTPTWWQPPPGDWLALLWAWLRQPQFYPLVALLTVGPALTILAALVPGWHRLVLVLAWAAFAAVLFTVWGDRVETMLWVLWWRVSG